MKYPPPLMQRINSISASNIAYPAGRIIGRANTEIININRLIAATDMSSKTEFIVIYWREVFIKDGIFFYYRV